MEGTGGPYLYNVVGGPLADTRNWRPSEKDRWAIIQSGKEVSLKKETGPGTVLAVRNRQKRGESRWEPGESNLPNRPNIWPYHQVQQPLKNQGDPAEEALGVKKGLTGGR